MGAGDCCDGSGAADARPVGSATADGWVWTAGAAGDSRRTGASSGRVNNGLPATAVQRRKRRRRRVPDVFGTSSTGR